MNKRVRTRFPGPPLLPWMLLYPTGSYRLAPAPAPEPPPPGAPSLDFSKPENSMYIPFFAR